MQAVQLVGCGVIGAALALLLVSVCFWLAVLIGAGAVWHWFRLHLIHPHGAPGTGAAGTVPPGQFCRLPEGSDSPPNGSEKQV